MQENLGSIPGGEDPLEEEMATHSSLLAWRIPWTEEPGELQSLGSRSQTRLSRHTQGEKPTRPRWGWVRKTRLGRGPGLQILTGGVILSKCLSYRNSHTHTKGEQIAPRTPLYPSPSPTVGNTLPFLLHHSLHFFSGTFKSKFQIYYVTPNTSVFLSLTDKDFVPFLTQPS